MQQQLLQQQQLIDEVRRVPMQTSHFISVQSRNSTIKLVGVATARTSMNQPFCSHCIPFACFFSAYLLAGQFRQ